MRIIGGPKENLNPKNVGILFFNDRLDLIIPYSYIQVEYIPVQLEGLREKTFRGAIPRQLIVALQYIQNIFLETEIVKVKGKAESMSIDNYPFAVLEEILPNAVLHRITKEKIEITGFPGIDRGINDKNIRELNFILRGYRNKRIGEFLKELLLVEAKNTGIPKAIRSLKNNNSPQLEFEMDMERSYVTVIIHIHKRFLKKEETKEERDIDLKQRILYKRVSKKSITNIC